VSVPLLPNLNSTRFASTSLPLRFHFRFRFASTSSALLPFFRLLPCFRLCFRVALFSLAIVIQSISQHFAMCISLHFLVLLLSLLLLLCFHLRSPFIHFACALLSYCDRYAIALQSISQRFAMCISLHFLGCFCFCFRFAFALQLPFVHFSCALQSYCDRFAIAIQSISQRFAIALQPPCNRLAIALPIALQSLNRIHTPHHTTPHHTSQPTAPTAPTAPMAPSAPIMPQGPGGNPVAPPVMAPAAPTAVRTFLPSL
jgi:hypothetical protein